MATNPPARAPRIPPALILAVMASGAAALGLQMSWIRLFSLGLGQELPSTFGVLTAFFGGLAAGSRWGGRLLERLPSAAVRCASLEALTAGWALLTLALLPRFTEASWQWLGPAPGVTLHWTASLFVPLVALFPATLSLGAMMPAMERLLSGFRADGARVGPLYGVNTLGAVIGVVGSVLWVQPRWGLSGSVIGFAGVQAGCAVLFLWAGRGVRPEVPVIAATPRLPEAGRGGPEPGASRLGVMLGVSGLLGIGFEVLATRLLSQVLENTVFTYAAILAAFLGFTALGGFLQNRFAPDARRALGWLLPAVALGLALAGWILRQTPMLGTTLRAAVLHDGLHTWALSAFAAEWLVTAAVVALPATAMGLLFASLAAEAASHPGLLGKAVSWNLLGSALAPAVVALGLVPALGTRWSWCLLGLGYLAIMPGWRRMPWRRWTGVGLAVIALALLPRDLHLQEAPPGGRIATLREGPADTVTTVVQGDNQRILRINQRFTMGGTASVLAERRHGHLPLLLHPEPKRALFLGVGTGISFSALDAHPGLVAEGVELVPEVSQVMPEFAPHNAHGDRLTVQVADARRFVRATTRRYDVVIADLFHPARDGAAGLYTREHFTAIRDRLADDGVFCQWLPLFQLDGYTLRVIIATFLEVYPDASALLLRLNADTPVIGLVGTAAGRKEAAVQAGRTGRQDAVNGKDGMARRNPKGSAIHPGWAESLESRLRQPGLAAALRPLALAEVLPVMGTWFADSQTLRDYSLCAEINTDDHPILLFLTPRTLGPVPVRGQALLSELLALPRPLPESLSAGHSAGWGDRLRLYLEARDTHLQGLIAESEGRPDEAEQGFLRSVGLSPDFTPGYAQLITRATLRARSDPEGARRLLDQLTEARPERSIARDLKARLGL
jgi:spermidine synthase